MLRELYSLPRQAVDVGCAADKTEIPYVSFQPKKMNMTQSHCALGPGDLSSDPKIHPLETSIHLPARMHPWLDANGN